MKNWIYDSRADTWFYGTENNGCGVFEDFDGHRMRWTGNVSLCSQVVCIGWRDSKEQAAADCVEQLHRMEQEI